MSTLTVGDLTFDVRRSASRKHLRITVDRGGELLITAPEGCARGVMEAFVREKRFWVYSKLAEKDALGPAPATKQYVNGEGFPYLGRSYRLLIVKGQDVPVKLEAGRFKMSREAVPKAREEMVNWYKLHALDWLERKVERLWRRVGTEPKGVTVRELGYRWGSCTATRRLQFNWRVALLPARLAEYVVVHELVHLRERNHTAAFWRRLERALPDCDARRTHLLTVGATLPSI